MLHIKLNKLNKDLRDNFTNPLKLYPLLQTPPNIQKLSLTLLELSKIPTYSPPYKLRPKYPCFSFLKKIKKHFGS
jgi:hypothetical protein